MDTLLLCGLCLVLENYSRLRLGVYHGTLGAQAKKLGGVLAEVEAAGARGLARQIGRQGDVQVHQAAAGSADGVVVPIGAAIEAAGAIAELELQDLARA